MNSEVDFIRKYIFPGGQLSSVKTLVDAIATAGLNVESIENIGPHYARTFREWGRRFQINFESHIEPALKRKYPDLDDTSIQIFRRKWTCIHIPIQQLSDYLAYTEAGFAMRGISESVFVTTREGNLLL
ncbi:hypothetical protein EV360DRAFT_89189 [Lentinula raphanica]|nr:hypothetical protein EV360DRAFT_89189 [Lentinula raphanica]